MLSELTLHEIASARGHHVIVLLQLEEREQQEAKDRRLLAKSAYASLAEQLNYKQLIQQEEKVGC